MQHAARCCLIAAPHASATNEVCEKIALHVAVVAAVAVDVVVVAAAIKINICM